MTGALPHSVQRRDIGQHQPRVVGSHVDRNLSCPQLQPGQVDVDHRLIQQPKVELISHNAQRRRLHILRTQRPDVDPHLRLHLRWYSLGGQCIPGLDSDSRQLAESV